MVKLSVRTTIVLLTVFVGLVSALFFSLVSYQFVRDSALASIEQEYSSSLDALVPLVEDTFHDAERDVLTLSNLPVLKDINGVKINSKNKSAVKLSVDEWHNRLARTFVSLMRNRDFYFQIRLIDSDTGLELVRVDRNSLGHPQVVHTLQDKSNEDYFRASLAMGVGQIYYSDITLNREFGQVSNERQVAMRVATPVADANNHIYGFLIINVDYPRMMASLVRHMNWGDIHYIIDHNGNYLEYSSASKYAMFRSAHSDLQSIRVGDYYYSLDSSVGVHYVADGEGGKNILVTKRVDTNPDFGGLHLLLVAAKPKAAVFALLSNYTQHKVWWSAIIIAACSLVAYMLAELVVSPIVKTIGILRSYADGRGELSIPETQFSELTSLAGSIKSAVDKTRASAESEAKMLLKYEVIFNTVADGILTYDRKGSVKTVNPAACAMFGYSASEFIGRNLSLFIPRLMAEDCSACEKNTHNSQQYFWVGKAKECLAVRKSGQEFPVELVITSQWINGDCVLIGLVRDITVRKQKEAEIKNTLVELKRSNEELDDFAYVISHDLKEPLRGMQMHCQKLLNLTGGLPDDAERRLQRVNLLSDKVQQQVSDLLHFSRLGRSDLNLQEVDCKGLVNDVVESLDGFLEERNAKVDVKGQMPVLIADKQRLTSILSNLITNGVKYNNSDRKVIEVGYHDSWVSGDQVTEQVFFVKDNGVGIEERFYKDIFRMFKRLNAEGEFGCGTGAGLTFVKKCVEKHGGSVWLESTPGAGTIFYFSLVSQPSCENPVAVNSLKLIDVN